MSGAEPGKDKGGMANPTPPNTNTHTHKAKVNFLVPPLVILSPQKNRKEGLPFFSLSRLRYIC